MKKSTKIGLVGLAVVTTSITINLVHSPYATIMAFGMFIMGAVCLASAQSAKDKEARV